MSLQTDGFLLLPAIYDPYALSVMRDALEELESGPGALRSRGALFAIRNLERQLPFVPRWAAPLYETVREILGGRPTLVRVILFDKPHGRPWWLPWHRDTTIAASGVHPDFRHPTVKAGVPHLEAPRYILSQMITARIHLDPANAANGALEVVPGSHLHDDGAITGPRIIACDAGDVLLMRPLVLHRSSRSTVDTRRRILHMEFAPVDVLPPEIQWAWGYEALGGD